MDYPRGYISCRHHHSSVLNQGVDIELKTVKISKMFKIQTVVGCTLLIVRNIIGRLDISTLFKFFGY